MKAFKPIILVSSLLCLILPLVGVCDEQEALRKIVQGETKMSEMTIEEAKSKLSQAEQVLQEVKDQVLRAEKRQLTLEEMLEVSEKVSKTRFEIREIPMGLIVSSGAGIAEPYNKLIFGITDEINKIDIAIRYNVARLLQSSSERTQKLETGLRSSRQTLNRVISRYPIPQLVKLRDQSAKRS